jgi:SAM-dependent methyltransferase
MSFITQNFGQFAYFDAQLGRPNWAGKAVLDFGGNTGNILKDPKSQVEEDRYWCIDVSRDAIRQGQKDHPRARFLFYDRYNPEYNPSGARGLPIPRTEGAFDYVLALSVFTHTSEAELLELTAQLAARLAEGGALAFTFLDHNHAPSEGEASNLSYYLPRPRWQEPSSDLNRALEKAKSARWCKVVKDDLYFEDDAVKPLPVGEQRRYLVFYTVEYVKALFPHGEILPPVSTFPRQHCCLLRGGGTREPAEPVAVPHQPASPAG